MPVYEFECDEDQKGCGETFTKSCSMNEISNLKPKCPGCNKKKPIIRVFGSVYVSDGSTRTVGGLADRNFDRMSDDEKHSITKKNTEKQAYSGPMPDGASLAPVDSQGNTLASTKISKKKPKKKPRSKNV